MFYVGCVKHTTEADELTQPGPNLFDIAYITENSCLSHRNRSMLSFTSTLNNAKTARNSATSHPSSCDSPTNSTHAHSPIWIKLDAMRRDVNGTSAQFLVFFNHSLCLNFHTTTLNFLTMAKSSM